MKHLPVPTRLRLLDALVIPVLLHGAGNWPLLSHQQLQHLHALYMRWLRSIIGNGFWAEDQLTDTQLLLQWKLPSMPMRLAKLRMLYAFHLFRLPPWSIELAGSLQCPDCVKAKQARPQPPANLNPIPQLWEIVGTDIYEFEYEDHKHKFILSCFGSWKNGDHDLYHVISIYKLELITIYNRYIVFFPLNKFRTKPLNQFCSTFSSFILPTFLWHLPGSRD